MEGAGVRLNEHDAATCALLTAPGRSNVGIAFVTFEEPESAERALRGIVDAPLAAAAPAASPASASVAHGTPGSTAASVTLHTLIGHGKRVSMRQAPEPSDVLWANLGTVRAERWKRQLWSTSLMLGLSLVGTGIIMTTIFFQRQGSVLQQALDPIRRREEALSGLAISLLLQLAMVVPVTLGNVILFWTVPALAEKYERHHTHEQLELSVAMKCTFFQCFNTLCSAAMFFADGYTADNTRQWYSLGGALLVNILFGDFIFIQVLMDWVRIDTLVARTILAPRASSQHEMNRIYAAPAGIYLAFRMQQAGKYVILAPMFGSAIPVLFIIATAYFWLGSWIDRYNLLRRLTPPPATDESLSKAAALYLFPTGVALHIIMALVFFAQLPLLSDGAKAAARAATEAAAALANATAALGANWTAAANATVNATADAFNATDQMLDTAQLYAGLVVLRKMSKPPCPSPNPSPIALALARTRAL